MEFLNKSKARVKGYQEINSREENYRSWRGSEAVERSLDFILIALGNHWRILIKEVTIKFMCLKIMLAVRRSNI